MQKKIFSQKKFLCQFKQICSIGVLDKNISNFWFDIDFLTGADLTAEARSAVSSKQSERFASAMDREGQRERLVQARKERLAVEEKKKKTGLVTNEVKAATLWGVYFQVAKASNVLQARKVGSKKKEAVLKTAQVLFH